ncbi:YqkE family protein [Paenibacillus alba]|uniref:YqkE family protein n=1 Tax=Paenibacillus alba TaxID=1197127 RepID=A0ABU6G8T8_9BACL|nr:YqkE family protein [Paenibacillus alba]MEC0230385.1 YqkE family protein [Paenibacillus alba]NQX69441.1 YqkE family protein [Paenibacillus alba]
MAKKKWSSTSADTSVQDKPATLKDLLRPEILEGLKAQADAMKAEEQARKDAIRAEAEAARKAEEKRLENDFGHLLEKSSLDWRKHK